MVMELNTLQMNIVYFDLQRKTKRISNILPHTLRLTNKIQFRMADIESLFWKIYTNNSLKCGVYNRIPYLDSEISWKKHVQKGTGCKVYYLSKIRKTYPFLYFQYSVPLNLSLSLAGSSQYCKCSDDCPTFFTLLRFWPELRLPPGCGEF